ncbi:MAG: hypothetical protein AMXMBFR33_47700 [Candidatus Xenobia bacterium]
MNVTTLSHQTQPARASTQQPAHQPPVERPPTEHYEPGVLDTLKNIVGVTAFAAGPSLVAAQWGLPGAAVGVGASMLAMYLMDRDREIMVPFVGLSAAVMTVPALLFGWPGALVSTALAAGYGYHTR